MTANQEMWLTLAIMFVFYSAHLCIDSISRRIKSMEDKQKK
jgi:hypothetical protein